MVLLVRSVPTTVWDEGATPAHGKLWMIDGPPGKQEAIPGYWLLISGTLAM
jgi:hypothetical protein